MIVSITALVSSGSVIEDVKQENNRARLSECDPHAAVRSFSFGVLSLVFLVHFVLLHQ